MTAPRKPTPPRKTAPKDRKTPISPARKAAFDVLLAVERGHSHSDDLLRGKAVNALTPADRNLATTLVLGVLRGQIRLDHQLQAFLKHPNARLDTEVRIALRLGAFQLLHLNRIPARAAIDESVELAKHAGHRFASGMVNAVLRKLASSSPNSEKVVALKGHDLIRAEKAAKSTGASAPEELWPEDTPAQLALAQAHPAWMVERWAGFYGLEATRAICHHGQHPPILTIRLNDPATESELTGAGIALEPGELLSAARMVTSGDVAATVAFHEDRVRFQDEGSQLVAEIAAANLNRPDGKILDACAAPGGKTLILAERNPESPIVACEFSVQRLEQLRGRLSHHAGQIECRLADATALEENSIFDLALTDVPCSGTGTLGRNPEIRHRLHLNDLPSQAERQRNILSSALRAVRPGGHVVYSTCSLEPEENEQVVAAVLAEATTAHTVSLESTIAALRSNATITAPAAARLQQCLTSEGALRLLPGVFHTDGFFIALIEKGS